RTETNKTTGRNMELHTSSAFSKRNHGFQTSFSVSKFLSESTRGFIRDIQNKTFKRLKKHALFFFHNYLWTSNHKLKSSSSDLFKNNSNLKFSTSFQNEYFRIFSTFIFKRYVFSSRIEKELF